MNRQIRRSEEKKERRQEEKKRKEKEERKQKRRERADRRKANARRHREGGTSKDDEGGKGGAEAPAANADGGGKRGGKGGGRGTPGRFSGALTFATLFFISLQAVTPTDGSLVNQIVSASFYLLFGYFAVLWMMRRGTDRAVPIAVIAGLLLAIGTAAAKWFQPDLQPETWTVALTPPLLVGGALLGRVVYVNAPG